MPNSVSYVRGIIPDKENREKDDFYPTPPEGTHALLSVEEFTGHIWEPACGDGAISKVLEGSGYKVRSTDLVDRGYGEHGHDFLMEWDCRPDNIITNPPFKLAEQFARHALHITTGKVALLCRLAWLEGKGRRDLFENSPLKNVWVFSKRLHMSRNGEPNPNGGMLAFAWFVWERGYTGRPNLGWVSPDD